jgi:hypothetical protein
MSTATKLVVCADRSVAALAALIFAWCCGIGCVLAFSCIKYKTVLPYFYQQGIARRFGLFMYYAFYCLGYLMLYPCALAVVSGQYGARSGCRHMFSQSRQALPIIMNTPWLSRVFAINGWVMAIGYSRAVGKQLNEVMASLKQVKAQEWSDSDILSGFSQRRLDEHVK